MGPTLISALRSATSASVGRMPAGMTTAFLASDLWQRSLIKFASEMLGARALNPRDALHSSLDVLRHSAGVLQVVMPGHEGTCDWQEFQNKLLAFQLFQQAIRRPEPLDRFSSVWALEGTGYRFAEQHWGSPLRSLAAPRRAWLPLHSGMGMALATRMLGALGPAPSASSVRNGLGFFLARCRGCSCPGYESAAIEPAGLVAWTVYPHLVSVIGAALKEMDAECASLFWHGVDRALYFAPSRFVPCAGSRVRTLHAAQHDPPDADARRNALAGLVWATALVNIRYPPVLRKLLHSDPGVDRRAFSNGAVSALLAWRDMVPDDAIFSSYTLESGGEHWDDLVRGPVAAALSRIYSGLHSRQRMGCIFRYLSWDELERVATGERG